MPTFFIDANVLFDFFLNREGVEYAREILHMGFNKQCHLYVSSLSFSHLAYTMRKVAKGKALYGILETLQEMVKIASVDEEVISKAIRLRADDFEDAIQYFSARKINADCIVTNNIKDFTYSEISVMKPSECIKNYGSFC